MTTAVSTQTPVKPPKLEPEHVYLQISYASSEPPSSLPGGASSPIQLKYVGPVGELKGEGIFEVITRDGGVVKRGEDIWQRGEKDVLQEVKKVEGVRSVKVMPELKQRAKRNEF
ncbi:hypothetical protein CI109_104141 [Kwoniella shandongensis]|uniref:Uncharacterized protein n=1 Tax=Kwoniella shandongensis TaxID=1734106 RepID=A0A5M6C0X0_9TREE|nr:uncharacterized protein CI109_002946 [Kwoniella shandongensis]KAA5528786.1 hypothetical protein CI109_002946 [Kwoniella shandongensis]